MQQGFVITLMDYLCLIKPADTVRYYRFFCRARAPVLSFAEIFTTTKQL